MKARVLKRAVMIGCALVATGLVVQNAEADDTYWTRAPGDPGNWLHTTNWSTFRLPTTNDRTYIDNGGTAQILSGSPRAMSLRVGCDHSGAVEQTGGALDVPWELYLGRKDGAEGTYTLRNGSVSALRLHVGDYGDGTFRHTAGTVTVTENLYMATFGGEGLYELSGRGVLNTEETRVGMRGPGTFRQTGGTHTCSEELWIGYDSTGFGIYELGGTGVLTAEYETVGYYDNGPGLFKQFAGSHTAARLHIRPLGRYEFTGGQLRVNEWLEVDGELALPGGTGNLTLGQGAFANLSATVGNITNPGNLSIHTEPNTLVMFPTGFDPHATFKSFTGDAEVHYPGMTLYVPPGCTAYFRQTIDDHVRCEGTLLGLDGGGVDLTSGIEVSGDGVLDAGESAEITIEDLTSGISGGRIRCKEQFIGYSGTARFTQTGGTNSLKWQIWLGHEVGSDGTYEMSNGLLDAGGIYVGREGTGTFTQTGGTNTIGGLYLVCKSGGEGTYELSGTGSLSAENEHIGLYGTGTFTQTGGTNTVTASLCLGLRSGSEGTYELSGTGSLSADREFIGYRSTGTFTQTGGTNTAATSLLLGEESTGDGTYELSNGVLSAGALTVGSKGVGFFHQTGGTAITDYVKVGPSGRYEFTGGNLAVQKRLDLEGGEFDFADSGQTLQVAPNSMMNFGAGRIQRATNASILAAPNTLVIFPAGFDPYDPTHLGSYVSSGVTHIAGSGPLVVPAGRGFTGWGELNEHVQCYGTITSGSEEREEWFDVTGGMEIFPGGAVDVSGRLFVEDTDSGMSGGLLTIHNTMYVGYKGVGHFVQTGGRIYGPGHPDYWTRGTVRLGACTGSEGAYELHDGELELENLYVGYEGKGTFTQTGGACTIAGYFKMGTFGSGTGLYELTGGHLALRTVELGYRGPATFAIEGDSAVVTVSEGFRLGRYSTFSAVPGAQIHMTGAAFENESTDPDALAGLGNLELIFEGGTGDTDPVEIGGEDRGAVYSGFVKNFTFGGLTLGGTDVGQVQLGDTFDNGNRGGPAGAAEAQYVKRLRVGAGSTLDLGGLNLYYLTGSLDPGATIFTGGGSLTWVPAVESVNATYLDSTFSPAGGDHGLGALTVTDAADIVVETADGSQTTHAGGDFSLTAALFSDTSTGGVAKGLFQGGTIDIEDAVGDDLLTADLLSLLLEEVQGQNLLAGTGWFELTGGSLEGGFPYSVGEMVQITFRIAPSDIDDFSQAFTGVSNITLTPEPATLGLVAAGLVAVWMRKRRVTK